MGSTWVAIDGLLSGTQSNFVALLLCFFALASLWWSGLRFVCPGGMETTGWGGLLKEELQCRSTWKIRTDEEPSRAPPPFHHVVPEQGLVSVGHHKGAVGLAPRQLLQRVGQPKQRGGSLTPDRLPMSGSGPGFNLSTGGGGVGSRGGGTLPPPNQWRGAGSQCSAQR